MISNGVLQPTRQPSVTLSLMTHRTLQLHSPSANIVGTPLPTDNQKSADSSRFEYPFPPPSSTSASPVSSELSPSHTQSHAPPPSRLTSPLPHHQLHNSPPSLPLFDLPFSPVHPKLRSAPPPVPPGLMQKKHWSVTMGFLPSKRRGSDSASSTSISSSAASRAPSEGQKSTDENVPEI
jgi:hypothetical protein